MTKTSRYILLAVISVLVGAVFSVSTDFRLLLQKKARASYLEKDEVETVLINGDGSLTAILSDEEAVGEGRYVGRLVVHLISREEKALRLTLTAVLSDGREMVIEDLNPIYVKQQVFRINRDHVKSVKICSENGRFSVGDIRVDNRFHWNRNAFIAGALITFSILSVFFSDRSSENPLRVRRCFQVVALSCGLLLVLLLPSGKVGNDEETHLQAVLSLASFPTNEFHISPGVMNQVTVTEYNHPEALPKGSSEKKEYESRLSREADYKNGALSPQFSVLPERAVSYLPMVLAVKAAKGLSLPWSLLIRAARLANLCLYVFLVSLALRVLPKGHLLMALIALFPENIFLASTVSYDPYVTGFLFLGSAFLLRLLALGDPAEKKFTRDYFLMLFSIAAGCLPKAVYAPLILAAVLVPVKAIHDRKKRRLFIGAAAAAFLLTVAVFIAPTVLAPPDTGDVRGSAEVSEASQIGFIFGNPLRYTGILLRQMITWIPQCMLGPDCSTFMGHLVNGSTDFQGLYVPHMILLLSIVLPGFIDGIRKGEKDGDSLRLYERLVILFFCFGASVLVWTSMYVAYTKPGAAVIDGVQGRYFIPLLFLEYFCIGGGQPVSLLHRSIVRSEQIWYDIYLAVIAVLAGASMLFCVVIPYCL